MPHTTKEAAVEFADKIRNAIGNSEKFIQKITVSIGVACLDEIKGKNLLIQEPSEEIYGLAVMRVKIAKNMGGNIVCSSSSVESYQEHIGKILVVDTDEVNIDVLKTSLENINYKVFTAKDGEEALNIAEREVPDVIISEIMLPKIDGFLLREKLLMQSYTRNIPFIIVSHLKDEDSVRRALSLEVEHYFKKPFMLSELLGIIKLVIKGEAYR